MIPLNPREVVLLGAHCDDLAIGAGGTLLELCRATPGLKVTALVLSGAGTAREEEERTALAAFCPKAELDLTVLDVPDGRLPVHWNRAKEALEALRRRTDPDVIFGPVPTDAHQDHRGLAKLIPTAFRSHLVLGYEILKWESDLTQPNVFAPLSPETLADKIDLLHAHYPSQHARTWFDEETFRGLARVRGVQCDSRYAEAFHVAKMTLSFATSFSTGFQE